MSRGATSRRLSPMARAQRETDFARAVVCDVKIQEVERSGKANSCERESIPFMAREHVTNLVLESPGTNVPRQPCLA